MEVGFSYAAFEANVRRFVFTSAALCSADTSTARHHIEEPTEGQDWSTIKMVVE